MNALFRQDTYLTEAATVITGIAEVDGRTAFLLRDLLFYPGGGGQPAEVVGCRVRVGAREYPVTALQKHQGDVFVVLDRLLPEESGVKKGEAVHQVLDGARRMTAARLHTLQHMLGGACRAVVRGYQTRGMEIRPGLEACTMYFQADGLPAVDEVAEVRARAEQAVSAGARVEVRNYRGVHAAAAELGAVLRQDPTLPPFKGSRMRTVLIIGADGEPLDASPCGGTHLRALAEVGRLGEVEVGAEEPAGLYSLSFRLDR
jgi:Ser-tRNA(Ala) deacylase AlaX